MSKNLPIQVNDEGPVVARLSGRGDLHGTIRVLDQHTVQIRLDDEDRPEFWAEVTVSVSALLARLVELRANQTKCVACGECCTMPTDTYCGECAPWGTED